MADLRTFSRRMQQLARDVQSNADKTVRTCALAVDATVVLATPVDTGRARSNWQVELNGANTSTREAYAPGSKRSTEGENTRAALEQASREIAQYVGGPNASIHITNNLPYIGKLNDGHSAQAPAGFVEKAVMVGVRAVRGAKVTRSVG